MVLQYLEEQPEPAIIRFVYHHWLLHARKAEHDHIKDIGGVNSKCLGLGRLQSRAACHLYKFLSKVKVFQRILKNLVVGITCIGVRQTGLHETSGAVRARQRRSLLDHD